ncbi:MAG: ATP-binding cassette domain-containing protein [Thioalkalispiraceae bacterium]|jgi:ABC-2 type transport system ATP-binding protein
MSKTLIEVEHLSRNYGALRAVNNVNFELSQGEVLGFLGPNGAGKSTTMQMLTGNIAPSQGSIRICGIDLLENPRQAKAEIGYLPEQPPLYRELTVNEYLDFAARINRIPGNKVKPAVERAQQRCGLEQVGKRLINNLSKGYQQRVGIAQAIIHSPSIVVLDEPTVGLDPIQIREIRQLIRELGNEHGVILSTHILPEVQMTCDRVQIINRGELVFADKIENLNQRMQASSLLMGLQHSPDVQTIQALTGVERAEDLGNGRWRIHYQPGHSPAQQLAQQAVQNNWGLDELSPEHKTLEQIFVDITTNEQQAIQEEHVA